MADLTITYDVLRREVGRFLSIGRDPADTIPWTPTQIQDVADILSSGLRRFYWHAVLPPKEGEPPRSPWVWSFLRPVNTLAISSGTATYDLPADFGGNLADLTLSASASGLQSIDIVPEETLRAMQATARQGTPQYGAVRVKPQLDGQQTRHELTLYPTPDASLTATYRYSVNPPQLDALNQYPIGGAQHSETILEACLAAAEAKLQDVEGVHTKRYYECLSLSIALDRQSMRAPDEDVWPLDNPATGLVVSRAYLKRLAGMELGFGPNQAAWSNTQAQKVKLALETGLRKFYSPLPLPGEKYGYEWKFLRPVTQLTLVADTYRYDLPADFGIIDGPLMFEPGSSAIYPPITIVSEHQVRRRLAETTSAGRPMYASILPKAPATGFPTRYELLVEPRPDQAYVVTYRYQVNPSAVDEDAELPYGGQPHAQTIIEAVLAACEEQVSKTGIHTRLFLERMIASVGHDRQVSAPDTMGYNFDPSDRPRDPFYTDHHCGAEYVTYNGVVWG